MTCSKCAEAVTKAVKSIPSVEDVSVSLDRGEVVVTGYPDGQAVRDAITEEGYEVSATV